jgi:hypothetical protein
MRISRNCVHAGFFNVSKNIAATFLGNFSSQLQNFRRQKNLLKIFIPNPPSLLSLEICRSIYFYQFLFCKTDRLFLVLTRTAKYFSNYFYKSLFRTSVIL